MGNKYNKISVTLMTILLVFFLLPFSAFGLPGDLNGSGRVDGFDLIMFGRAYGTSASDSAWNQDADMNHDGKVDDEDLNILSTHFGRNGVSFGLWVGSESGTERVFKLSSTGNILQKNNLFTKPVSIAGDFKNNAVWVADSASGKVFKLSGFDGKQLVSVSGIDPYSVSVDSRDGSVWVADKSHNRLVKLLPSVPDGYSVETDTGSHITINGFNSPRSVSVNSDNGVIWVADTGNNTVVRLLPDIVDGYDISSDTGSHFVKSGFRSPYCVSVNSANGTAWVADYSNNQVVKLSASGITEIVRVSGFNQPINLDTSSTDGSVWVADYGNNQVVRLAADGALIYRANGFKNPYSVGVNPLDGSAWVADYNNDQVVKLSPNGTEIMRIGGFTRPIAVSVIPDEVSSTRYPTAIAKLNINNVNLGDTINFVGTGYDPNGKIMLYQWDFDGDGTFDFTSHTTGLTTHSYDEEGLYNPVFRVTDDEWLTAENYSQIVRVGQLKAIAKSDVISGTAPLAVNFSGDFVDPIDGFVDSFQWDFDGNNIFDYFSKSSPVVKHTYSRAGSYLASLKVMDGPHYAIDQIMINVTSAPPVILSADVTPSTGTPPLKVEFTGSARDSDGKIMLYEWDFDNDGTYDWSSISGLDTSFVYGKAGSYTAKLRVTDNDGLTSTATVDIEADPTIQPLTVVANADTQYGKLPLTVNFDAAGSSTANAAKYEWKFGDTGGFSGSTDGTVSHTYNKAGKFDAVLQITDTKGNKKTDTITIEVIPADFPEVTATANPVTGDTPLEVTFTGNASDNDGTITSYAWNFGEEYVWTSDGYGKVIRIRQDGSGEMARSDGFQKPYSVSINPVDGTVWVADYSYNGDVVRLSANGLTELTRIKNFSNPVSVSVNPTDGTIWVADEGKSQVVKFAGDGTEIARVNGFSYPKCVSVNPIDGSVWVADYYNNQVVKLASDGTGLVRISGFSYPVSVAVNSADGTVWVANSNGNNIVRLNSDIRDGYHIGNDTGSHMLIEGFNNPSAVAVNTSDNSIWVADSYNNQVVHLKADGSELFRADGFSNPVNVAVNSTTGIVWVADYGHSQVVKLSPDGKEIARLGGISRPRALAVADTGLQNYYTSSSTGNTTHTYAMPGIYHAIFTATDNDGNSASRSVDISILSAPKVVAKSDTIGGDAPLEVFFTADVTNLNGKIIAYEWDFDGDGTYDTFSEDSPNIRHIFPVAGTYSSTLKVTTDIGYNATDSVSITVSKSPPDAKAEAAPIRGNLPFTVNFKGSGSDADGTIVKYEWDFDNDGTFDFTSTTTGETTHTYTSAKTYTAVLKVTDNQGLSDTDSLNIIVKNESTPEALIYTPSKLTGFSPHDVNFYVNGIDPNGTIAKYEIDFDGDGIFETIQPASFGDNMDVNSANWTASGSWARTTSTAHSPSYCWTDSPDENYADNTDTSLTSTVIDLSAASAPKLIFWHKYALKSHDYARVEVSSNNGSSWSQIKYFFNATMDSWTREEIDLKSYAGKANVKIRFRLTTNGSDTADGWYIDDVWVGEAIHHTYTGHGNYNVALRVTDNDGNSSVAVQKITILAEQNKTYIWVADDNYNNQIVKLSDMGDVLARIKGFNRPKVVEVNPETGNVWVSDTNNDRVVKLSKDVPDGYDVSLSYAEDSKGDNRGIIRGDTSVTANGHLGSGLHFDGNGDYVEIPDSAVLRMNSWTLEAWIKPESLTGNRTIIGKVSQGKDFALVMVGDKISALVYDGGRQYVSDPDPATKDQWYHVAAVYDTSTGKLKLYVDGTSVAEKVLTPDTSNTDPLMVGRSNCCGEYFLGVIDDVRVWNIARTAAQIASARQSELAGNETGLVGYWKFNAITTPYHTIVTGFDNPMGLSVNTSDNTLWVADQYHNQVVLLDSDGKKIKRINGFYSPAELAVNPADGTLWVSDANNDRVVRLSSSVPDGFLAFAVGITEDYTSNKNSGFIVGNTADTAGKLSKAMDFDGSGDYIIIPPDPAIDVQNFTIEAWVKGTYVTNKTLFMRGDAAGKNELYFGFDNSTTLEAIIDNGSSIYFTGDVNFTDGKWHHVALVYDSTQLSCYVDNAAYGSPVSITATLDFGKSQAIIGADFDSFNGSTGNYFKGAIDDVRLWNLARTQTDITGSMDNEIDSSTAGLVGYWKLNSISASYARTITGFDNPQGMALDPSDNGIWVADYYHNQVVKLDSDGKEIYRKSGFNHPYRLAWNPGDHMVWVADYDNDRLVKLRSDGIENERISGFNKPHDLAVNPEDSTVWVADYYNRSIVKLSPDGTEMIRIHDFNNPLSLSIDPAKRNQIQPPTALASASPTSGTASFDVTFTGTGTDNGSIVSYSWDFEGDGIYDYTSSSTGSTTHTYTSSGTFNPVFRVTDDTGLMTYASPGAIYAGPLAIIPSAIPETGNAPLKVTLNARVTGLAPGRYIQYYQWDFDGDGTFDYWNNLGISTAHTYDTGGNYTAIVKAVDNKGNTVYASIPIQVAKQAPTISNYATPTTGDAPLTVSLKASGRDKDGSVIRYEWDYDGNGTYDWFSDSESDTFFTYKTPGTYDSTIRITDNDGLTATATKTITVTEKQNPPMAKATSSALKGHAPLIVTFTGTGTDIDGQIQLYEWDFDGDGTFDYSSATSGNTSHTYNSPGLFHPVFRVTDNDGLTATADLVLTIQDSNAPTAHANANIKTGATPLTINFNAAGSSDPDGNIVRYDWSFGNDLVWVADYNGGKVHLLNGYHPNEVMTGFSRPYRLSVNLDGTVWLSDYNNNQIVKLAADGKGELARSSGFRNPYGVASDPADGGVWIADYGNSEVVKLDSMGDEIIRVGGFYHPTSVAVDSNDNSVWVTDYNHSQVVKLDSSGVEKKRISGFNKPFWVSVNQSDGSAWIADRYNNRVVKLSGNMPKDYNTTVTRVTPEAVSGLSAMLFNDATAAAGKLSGAVSLDGNGDYVQISDDAFADMDNFTIEAWVKSDNVYNRAVFMRGNSSGGNELYFGFANKNTIAVILDNGVNKQFTGTTDFTDGNWYHVALTYDSASKILSCYVNGEIYGTPAESVTASLKFEGSDALIGADFDSFNGSLGNYFDGEIDDVRIWDIVRTGDQLKNGKDKELTGSESGLVAYWKLNSIQATPYHKILNGFNGPVHTAVNPLDNTAWICDYANNQMVRVSSDCSREIFRVDGFKHPHESVVNPVDGSVWVADFDNNQIVLLTDKGKEIRRLSGFRQPTSVAVANTQLNNLVSLTSDQTISHTYPDIGEYIATLTVTDNNGNTDTDTISIKAGTYPEAIANAYPSSGAAPLTVRFAANGYSPDGTIEYFRWDFDGNGSTDWTTRISENKAYTFTRPGIYKASLTVTDNRGLTDTKTVTITVLSSNTAPVVSVSAEPDEGRSPLNVTLTGLGKDTDGTIVKFEWDFDGDGTYDYTSPVSGITSHKYTNIGIYTPKLRVTDNDGNNTTGTTRVEVKQAGSPRAKILASVTTGNAALDVKFTGSGSEGDTIVKYEWDFDGDGTYDTTSTTTGNAEYVYTSPGSFNAVLRVTNGAGLTDTDSINILVSAGIIASLNKDSFDPTAGETVNINSVLTAPALVTVLITDRSGNTIRTLIKDVSRSQGYYSDIWDGKNDAGKIMNSGAYLYIIRYKVDGQTFVYDVTNNIELKRYTPSVVYPKNFNPFNADSAFFRYTLDIKSEITVYISPFSNRAGERIKTLMLRVPQKSGSYVLTWDGTDDDGNLVPAGNYVIAVMAWRLPENAVIINTRPIISDLSVKPSYLNPDALPYNDENKSILSYTLSKKADVSMAIYDSYNYIVRTITMKDVPAGTNNIISWDGKNADNENVTPGLYRSKLIAIDANGVKSYDANALLIIFY